MGYAWSALFGLRDPDYPASWSPFVPGRLPEAVTGGGCRRRFPGIIEKGGTTGMEPEMTSTLEFSAGLTPPLWFNPGGMT